MRTLNLALQGGGSHGAFTWGVLDRLLESGEFAFDGISGTSAGAINAAALATGWALGVRESRDPAESAREKLRDVWEDVVALGALNAWHRQLAGALAGLGGPWWPELLPQATPLAFNPLRDVLERRIDIDALRSTDAPRVFVSATQVRTGRGVVFSGERLTVDALLASACLPQLFPAVTIDGEPYWDGGYSANPALMPLVIECRSPDVLLVQINPLRRESAPSGGREIIGRTQELAFNAGLLTQLRALAHMNELVGASAWLLRRTHFHRVDGGAFLQAYSHATRSEAAPALVREFFSLGRDAAAEWLGSCGGDVGKRSSVDIRADYADDSWLPRSLESRPMRSVFDLFHRAVKLIGTARRKP